VNYVIRQPRVPPPMAYLAPKDGFFPLSAMWIDEDNGLWSSTPSPPYPKTGLWPSDAVRFQAPPSPRDPQGWCVLNTEGELIVATSTAGSSNYDENVAAFQVVSWNLEELNSNVIYVLGTDSSLWLETQPKRDAQPVQVDGNVAAFQAMDADHAFVLGSDGNLWLANSPWGFLPPRDRQPVAADVMSFSAADDISVYVLDRNGELTLREAPSWSPGPNIATGVLAFTFASNGVYWITEVNGVSELYLSTPISPSPATAWKQNGPIDANVAAIACNTSDPNGLLVLGTDGNLWYEPGTVQGRTLVASDVWTHPLPAAGPNPGL